MSSRGALTGGTGDVNPQIWKIQVTTVGVNATTNKVALPVQRLRNSNKSMTMELLQVKYDVNITTPSHTHHVFFGLSTQTLPVTNTVSVIDNTIIDYNKILAGSGTYGAGPSTLRILSNQFVTDFTDKAAHGVLVATDGLGVWVMQSDAAVGGVTVTAYIYYRWKNVGLKEYIGIVQSMGN